MIAITGGKGGCGKTTTTLGLASVLAGRGYDPLVVDADCDMPDLHHRAMIDRDTGVDALANGASIDEVVRRSSSVPGPAIVTAGQRDNLGAALGALKRWDGPVLVDCAAGASPDALLPLRYADSAIVVSTDAPASLDDSRRTATVARELDAPPLGYVIRTTSGGPNDEGSIRREVLARPPSVTDPLADPDVRRAWNAVSETITRQFRGDRRQRRRQSPVEDSRGSRERSEDSICEEITCQ